MKGKKVLYFSRVSGESREGVYRWIEDADGLYLEVFNQDTQKWADCPSLFDACGIGGDNPFVRIDEAEAESMVGAEALAVPPTVRL